MSGTRRAVIIGIDKYSAAPKLAELKGAVNDATDVHKILTKNGNFTVDPKHFLIDKRATSDNIRAAISDIFWKTEEECEIALLYFAGHGVKDHLDYGYLLPHDCDHNAPFVKGIRIQELKQLFVHPKQLVPIKTGIMILDCCYSGIATEPMRGDPDEEADRKNFQEELQLENTGNGRFILASARANETAREKEQKHAFDQEPPHVHGLYSFHLIEGLTAGASDTFGYVNLGALIKYVNHKFDGGDAKHRPQHSESGFNEYGIELTRVSEVYEKEIQKRYRKIEGYIQRQSARDLLAAADELAKIAERGEKEIVARYKTQIQAIFNSQANYLYNWWIRNGQYIYEHTGKCSGFLVLRNNLRDCKLQDIRLSKDRGFIIDAMETILEGADSQPFQSQDNPCVQQIVTYIEKFDPELTLSSVFSSDGVTSNKEGAFFSFGTDPPRNRAGEDLVNSDTGNTLINFETDPHGRPPSVPFARTF
jgi:hypothetical protein